MTVRPEQSSGPGWPRWVPYATFVVAIGVAYAYSHTHDPRLRWLESGVFAALLGVSGILWGVNELRSGRALVITQTAFREDQPFVFWSVILVFRFAIGAVLLAAGLWRLVGSPGP